MDCKNCGNKASEGDNFCIICGTKLNEVCTYCWVKKKDNYSCEELCCPGYNLFALEKSKVKSSLVNSQPKSIAN